MACSLTPIAPNQTPSPVPLPTTSATSAPPQPTATVVPPTPTPVLDSGWEQLRPGLERRWLRLEEPGTGRLQEQIFLLRLQPEHFTFTIGYQPGEPLLLRDWQAETDALIIMNGGFFTPEYLATGLVVANGQVYGQSYVGFGGMLALTAEGVHVRWLAVEGYRPDKPLTGAIQAFPMLVQPGGHLGYPNEDGDRSRRAVVAQDFDGRLIMLVTNLGHFTLHQLANYLIASDLNIDRALNLDGGTSAGLLLTEPDDGIGAFIAVPTVIVVRQAQERR